MATLQYVCVDVSSAPSDSQMTQNTNHNDMDGLWQEWVDVHSRYSVKKMRERKKRLNFITYL